MAFVYFSEAEYREVTGDDGSPPKASTSDISRSHDEVVARLEAWARSAWVPRSTTQTEIGWNPLVLLSRQPLRSITTFTADGDTVTDYDVDAGGLVRWLDWSNDRVPRFFSPATISVTYSYGFDAPGWEVKRPCIQAAESLLGKQEGRSRIPKNVTAYRTEGTSFDLSRDVGSRTRPWPWDPYASNDIRQFWEPFRPKSFVGVG